ncbi:alpha/beta hydrolase family protein [Jejuia spongiicola]|uniref:CocE/NonD family hydrolase n=1 Tax=Jejuia spongiicola TaxID=2942207 RepID=A0ABT0QIM6_9FLAO|nr:alpha/beta fold hydrolase [Jejuia spongiicola]MCL6296333.1 CocE/NonD family hydrolase [Jejuia spongiicola]
MKNILCIIVLIVLGSCINQPKEEKSDADAATYFRNKPLKSPIPYKSETIEFKNVEDSIMLRGTLTYPDTESQSYPAVVLMHGSGRNVRDYKVYGHKTFLTMTDYLSRNGIAVLRYDKRGCGESEGDFDEATYDDFASDGWSAAQYLKDRKDIDFNTIGIAGHSEGGSLVPMIAAEQELDFIILLGAPGLPYPLADSLYSSGMARARGYSEEQILRESQVNDSIITIALDMELGQVMEDSIYNLAFRNRKDLSWLKGLTGEALDDEIKYGYIEYYARPSFREFWEGPSPEDYLRQVRCPVLSIGGTLDLNVPGVASMAAIDKALKEAGNTEVTSELIPDLNHMLQPAKTGLPEEIDSIETTIASEVLILMKSFIQKQGMQ